MLSDINEKKKNAMKVYIQINIEALELEYFSYIHLIIQTFIGSKIHPVNIRSYTVNI